MGVGAKYPDIYIQIWLRFALLIDHLDGEGLEESRLGRRRSCLGRGFLLRGGSGSELDSMEKPGTEEELPEEEDSGAEDEVGQHSRKGAAGEGFQSPENGTSCSLQSTSFHYV